MAETTGAALLALTREAIGAIKDMAAAQQALESTCLSGLDEQTHKLSLLEDRIKTLEHIVRPAVEVQVEEKRAKILRHQAWTKFWESTAAQWGRWWAAIGVGIFFGRSPELVQLLLHFLQGGTPL